MKNEYLKKNGALIVSIILLTMMAILGLIGASNGM